MLHHNEVNLPNANSNVNPRANLAMADADPRPLAERIAHALEAMREGRPSCCSMTTTARTRRT